MQFSNKRYDISETSLIPSIFFCTMFGKRRVSHQSISDKIHTDAYICDGSIESADQYVSQAL